MAEKNQDNQSNIGRFEVISATYKEDLEVSIREAMSKQGAPVTDVPRVDDAAACRTVEASHEKLVPLRETFIAKCGPEAGPAIDLMFPLARGTLAAIVALQLSNTSRSLRDLHQDVMEKRGLVWNALESLVHRKIVRAEQFAGAQDVQGYEAIKQSVLSLVLWARNNWALVETHTHLTKDDLAEAEHAAMRLHVAVTRRDGQSEKNPVEDLRNRALIALVRHYEEIRRMVRYVRHYEGDAELLAPTLYQKGKGTDSDEEPPVTPAPAEPTEPELDPTAPGGPFSP